MTAIQVDPRVIAEALHIDTDGLAKLLTEWAAAEMPSVEYGDRSNAPTPLDLFDEMVGKARRYLEDAHAAQTAYEMDTFPKGGERVQVAGGEHEGRWGTIIDLDFDSRSVTVELHANEEGDERAVETFELLWLDVYTD